MGTREVADDSLVTPRAVVKAIADGRLEAEQVDGRWRVQREAVAHYRAARAAS